MGEGHPYKVEGIGGDKIPTTVWFDCDRRVPASVGPRRRCDGAPARARGGDPGRAAPPGSTCALALDVAREVDDPDALIVTILCDTGERYLSKLFNDDWMQENQLLDTPALTVQELLARRSPNAPAAGERGAGGRGAPGAQPDEHLGREPDPGARERANRVGGLIEGTLMTRALAQPALLDRPVREVMEPPFPVVDAALPIDRLGAMLTRESPAALVRKDGTLVGIVSRYDVLQQLIGTR